MIAAAPALFEALAYFVAQMDSFHDCNGNQADAYYHFIKGQDQAWRAARAALAVAQPIATGEG